MQPPKSHVERIIEAEIASTKKDRRAKSPAERIAITQQQRILGLDPRRILVEDAEVYDDRQSRQQ